MVNMMERVARIKKAMEEGTYVSPNKLSVARIEIDEDYSIKCLNCGRIVYCGKCCDNHITKEMQDKMEIQK